MNEIEIEATIEELRTLTARLETLRHMKKTDLELQDQQTHYQQRQCKQLEFFHGYSAFLDLSISDTDSLARAVTTRLGEAG